MLIQNKQTNNKKQSKLGVVAPANHLCTQKAKEKELKMEASLGQAGRACIKTPRAGGAAQWQGLLTTLSQVLALMSTTEKKKKKKK